MTPPLRFSANINTFNACADRYVLSGYGERLTTDQLIQAATQVKGLTGVEVVGLWHVNDENVDKIGRQIHDAGLEVTCVTPDIWASSQWGWGSFASNDPKIRRAAVQEVKKSMGWAKQLNCEVIDLWFGQDGYDYPFQADYPTAWQRIIDGTLECAEFLPEIKLVLEYKPKEPRTHCFIATVGKTLLLIDKVNRANVGAMIDVGHALMGYENVAESASLLNYFGKKLFYMHFNDNWRLWDDDMTVGSVHTIEMLELLYWLDRLEYRGWYALDIFPYRENGLRAASESIRWIEGLHNLLDKIGREHIAQVVSSGDAMAASEMIRHALLG
jgi:sugar phosphate isomerase/epimerase